MEGFLPLGLGGLDVILGIQWLETLGMTHTNWKSQVMKFQLGNEMVTLREDSTLGKTLVPLKAMKHTLRHEGSGFLVELNQIEAPVEEEEHGPVYLQEVLTQHASIFNMPKGLPLVRGQEHSIVLKEGTLPISVQPYRYPHV